MTSQPQALIEVLEAVVDCRRCGEPMLPNGTGEDLCGICWRRVERTGERLAQAKQSQARVRTRKGAQ